MKIPFVISADTESLLEKIPTRKTNLEESSTRKISKHMGCDN